MKIYSYYLGLAMLFMSICLFAQDNLSSVKLAETEGNYYENNGIKVIIDNDNIIISANGNIIFDKSISGIKVTKFSEDNKFNLIQNFDIPNEKDYGIANSFLFDSEYKLVESILDTVYKDYPAKIYALNTNGVITTLNSVNGLLTVMNKSLNKEIKLQEGFEIGTESKNFVLMDNDFIYVIRNITNPSTDEINPGKTILYKVEIESLQILINQYPINVVTSFCFDNEKVVLSGIKEVNGINSGITYILNENLETEKEIDLKFTKIINYGDYYFALNGESIYGINKFDYSISEQKSISQVNNLDFWLINNKLFIADKKDETTFLYSFIEELNRFEFNKEVEQIKNVDKIIRLNSYYLFDENKTIIIN